MLRRRMMLKAKSGEVVDDTLIIFGTYDTNYIPVQGNYGLKCNINGTEYEYYQNDAPFFIYDNGENQYNILTQQSAGRLPSDFYHVTLPANIMSEVNPLITEKDNSVKYVSLAATVVSNNPTYVVKEKTVNGVTKYVYAHKIQVGTVDPTYIPLNNKPYGFKMSLDGSSYGLQYYSDDPFFIKDNENGTYNLLVGRNTQRNPSQTFTELPSNIMQCVNVNINGYESNSRNQTQINSIISNYPVYLVKNTPSNKYFYVSD